MIALYILLVLLVLLLLPLGARVRFDGECRVTVRYSGLPVYRFASDKPEKPKKPKKSTPKKQAKSPKKAEKQPQENALKTLVADLKAEGASATVQFLCEVARLVSGTLRRLFRALHFRKFEVAIAVTGTDAADAALKYGKLCGVVYPAKAELETWLRVRRVSLVMRPDFLREKDAVVADIRLFAFPLALLWAAIRTLFAALWLFVKQSMKKEEEKHG